VKQPKLLCDTCKYHYHEYFQYDQNCEYPMKCNLGMKARHQKICQNYVNLLQESLILYIEKQAEIKN